MRSGRTVLAALGRAGEGDPGAAGIKAAELPAALEGPAAHHQPSLAMRAVAEPAALVDQASAGHGEAAAGEVVLVVLPFLLHAQLPALVVGEAAGPLRLAAAERALID